MGERQRVGAAGWIWGTGRMKEKRQARGRGIAFNVQCRAVGIVEPVAEYQFHPTRRWRFDWAWPLQKVALEIDGGVFIQGRHSRGVGMVKDMEKYNQAAILRWRVIRVTPKMLSTGEAINVAADALGVALD